MVSQAELAAAELASEEIETEVIDLRTLSPLDMDTVLESAARTRRVLIVEEGVMTGGVAGEIGFRIQEALHGQLDAPVRRLAVPDCPIPAARTLESSLLPSAASIAAAALDLATL
jgi:pyruvate dehydrogenase E1 component beta subunit